MITAYYIINSVIDGEIKTEDFIIYEHMLQVLDRLDEVAFRVLGEEFEPLEDGTVGFYSSKGWIYLEERDIIKA